MTEEHVRKIVSEALEDQGAFLVEMNVRSSGKIMVYADKNGGIGIGNLKMISRAIENALEEESGDFEIEVSSPGMGNPFKVFAQYEKNRGREVKVRMKDGTTHAGKLTEVSKETIVLELSRRVPKEKGKGKITVVERLDIPMDEIEETKLEIKF